MKHTHTHTKHTKDSSPPPCLVQRARARCMDWVRVVPLPIPFPSNDGATRLTIHSPRHHHPRTDCGVKGSKRGAALVPGDSAMVWNALQRTPALSLQPRGRLSPEREKHVMVRAKLHTRARGTWVRVRCVLLLRCCVHVDTQLRGTLCCVYLHWHASVRAPAWRALALVCAKGVMVGYRHKGAPGGVTFPCAAVHPAREGRTTQHYHVRQCVLA